MQDRGRRIFNMLHSNLFHGTCYTLQEIAIKYGSLIAYKITKSKEFIVNADGSVINNLEYGTKCTSVRNNVCPLPKCDYNGERCSILS